MAEAVGLAASIIAVLDLSAKVVSRIKAIIETAKDAPRDLRTILVEVSSLKSALENLEFLSSIDCEFAEEVSNQQGVEAAVKGCQHTLTHLVDQLGSLSICDSQQTGPSKRQKIKTAVSWTWKEGPAKELLADVLQYKTTIMLGLLTHTAREVHETKLAVDNVQKISSEEQKYKIWAWLEQTNPSVIHNLARKNHEIHTCEWILRIPHWKSWLESRESHRFLWIHGIPGAGKTILASFLIEQCRLYCQTTQTHLSCVYYYCSYRNNQDESIPLLRWLVCQLSRLTSHVPKIISDVYRLNQHPSAENLTDSLVELLGNMKIVYLVVDAVDESRPRWRAAHKATISDALVHKAKGMFRLAFCQIEILLKKRTAPELYESLKHLPETIEDSYEMIILDTERNDWPILRAIFIWIYANDKLPGQNPIPLNTLCSMISRDSSNTTGAILKYSLDDIKEICGCLITIQWHYDDNISDDPYTDDESSSTPGDFDSVRFAHYKVVEYLFSNRITQGKAAYFALSEDDTIDTFLGTVLEIATKTEVESLVPEYWTGLEHYCARAAWLAPFVWESKIVQTERLWTASTKLWLATGLYFKHMDNIFDSEGTSIGQRSDELLRWETLDSCDLQDLRGTLTITISTLLLNSCWTLARRLVVENNVPILCDTPLYFSVIGFTYRSGIPPKEKYLGSAVEALAMSCIGYSMVPFQRAIDLMKYDVDITRVALICTALHLCEHDCGCGTEQEDADQCYTIQSLRDYDSRRESMAYCLTPLQLAVHCWDYLAIKALLERDVDPNGLGSLSGESVPIHIYKVHDSWGSASPLHILRHAGYALESIDDHLNIMERCGAFRDKIGALLISYGATDFVRLPPQET